MSEEHRGPAQEPFGEPADVDEDVSLFDEPRRSEQRRREQSRPGSRRAQRQRTKAEGRIPQERHARALAEEVLANHALLADTLHGLDQIAAGVPGVPLAELQRREREGGA